MSPVTTALPRLGNTQRTAPKPPIRIVHLGLGAFHRSHQAWYTHHAGDAAEWGIAAFTGRRPNAAHVLAEQDGLYTVVERSDSGDSFELVGSIVEAVDGADVGRLTELLAAPATAIVTLTITEAGYGLGRDGMLDTSAPAVAGDIAELGRPDGGTPSTPLGRLVLGLAARRQADAGPIAVVCCDNLADNGAVARNAVVGMAQAADASLAEWIDANASFVSTSVDRITPRTTPADIDAVSAACGYVDESPVVTEPFHSWVLSGDFPGGRPRWEDAGAMFVDRIEPYENRKLWLLNGAHSLLSYAGQLRGHATVAEALADGRCRAAVEAFWDEASAHLPDPELRIPEYRAALLERFGNSRIAHYLSQIAMDGSTKLRLRAVPVVKAERSDGRSGEGAARMIASWMDYVSMAVGNGQELADPLEEEITRATTLADGDKVRALLSLLDPDLAADPAAHELLRALLGEFAAH